MMEDRLGGVWNRFTVAGVKPNQFLISHLSFGSCLMLIQSIEFLGFALYIAFDINLNYVVMVSLLLVLMGLTGVLYGLILSIITDNTLVSSIGSLLAMYPFLCLSGKNILLFLDNLKIKNFLRFRNFLATRRHSIVSPLLQLHRSVHNSNESFHQHLIQKFNIRRSDGVPRRHCAQLVDSLAIDFLLLVCAIESKQ